MKVSVYVGLFLTAQVGMAARVAQQAGLKLGLIWATAKLPAKRMRIVFIVTLNLFLVLL